MRTLRARLFLSILLPVLIIVPVVALMISYLLETQVLVANIANEVIRQAVLVADLSSSYIEIWQDPSQAQAFVARMSPRLTAKLMLLDPTGRLIVSSDPNDSYLVGKVYEMPDLQRLLEMDTPVDISYKGSQISDVTVPVVNSSRRVIGFVRLTNPLANVYVRSERLRQVTLYVASGGILAGLLLGFLFARDLERPLRKTSSAVYNLAGGQQPLEQLKEEGPDEIRRLIHAFNVLMERLKTSEESRRRLLANMVHELGRPLGALLSALQALRGGAEHETALRRELLTGMESEVVVLQHLLDDLSRLDQDTSQIKLERQVLRPSEWLPTALSTWEQSAREKEQDWQIDIPADLPEIQADPNRLSQALGNLASNAIHYTPEKGIVRIAASSGLDTLKISVQDSGPGIAPEEQEMVFQPFYRGKTSRRFSDGMGLGLTIARDLVRAHGGDITLESTPGHGARFEISLPIN